MLNFIDFITENIVTFEKIEEGNPLARLHKNVGEGRHFSILSGQREGLSTEDNMKRHRALKAEINKAGFAHKEVEGHWEGNRERSIMVYAKEKGDKAGEALRQHTNSLGRKYEQDSVFHHDGKKGFLVGTNKTGYPGENNVDTLGKIAYNRQHAPGQTEMKPKSDKPLKQGRTSKSQSRFTME